jgi:hypothetical protein
MPEEPTTKINLKQDLRRLIADAERLADAAILQGKLKDDTLVNAIEAAEKALESEKELSEARRQLQICLAACLRDFEQTTIVDLRDSWEIGVGFRKRRADFIVTAVISFILLFFTAYSTSIYNRALIARQDAIELQRFSVMEASVRVVDLVRLYSRQNSQSAQAGPGLEAQSLFRVVHEIAQFQQSRLSLEGEFREILRGLDRIEAIFTVLLTPVTLISEIVWRLSGWLSGGVLPTNLQPQGTQLALSDQGGMAGVNQAQPSRLQLDGLPSSLRETVQRLQPTSPQPGTGIGQAAPPSSPGPSLPNDSNRLRPEDGGNATRPGSELSDLRPHRLEDFLRERNLIFQALQQMDAVHRLHDNFDHHIRSIKPKIDNLANWILPGLYGALGAIIFFMRRYLNPNLANPDLTSVCYRTLIGGFAAVIFAWLWSYLPSNARAEGGLSPAPFVLAFIVGYSTDLLFQALDQAVDGLSRRFGSR